MELKTTKCFWSHLMGNTHTHTHTLWPAQYNEQGVKVIGRVAAAAKSLQSCPTLCNPIDGSPPGFPILGILQARTLE